MSEKYYVTKQEICKDIKKGDVVTIVPEYTYMIGTNVRIKEYFNLKAGEVLISKNTISKETGTPSLNLARCRRTLLKEYREDGTNGGK